jgi:hypothetical protein
MKVFIEEEEASILGLEGPKSTHDRDEYVLVELDQLLALGPEGLMHCNFITGVLPAGNFRAITSIIEKDRSSEYVYYSVKGIEISLPDMEQTTFYHTFSDNIDLAEEEEGFVWPKDIKS